MIDTYSLNLLRPARNNRPDYLLSVVTPPTAEPVTYQELSDWLKLDQTDDQILVTSLGVAARNIVEESTKHCFMQTTYSMTLDTFDGGGIKLPRRPVTSVTSITYLDNNLTTQTLPTSSYGVARRSIYSRVVPLISKPFPVTGLVSNAVTITFVAGNNTDISQVPELAKTAIKMMTQHLYENRGEMKAELPDAYERIIGLLNAPGV